MTTMHDPGTANLRLDRAWNCPKLPNFLKDYWVVQDVISCCIDRTPSRTATNVTRHLPTIHSGVFF